jgi:hypothetical protein
MVVLSISLALKIGCEGLWLTFGTGTTFRYIDATTMDQALGNNKCKALPAFHALTGYDVTSAFAVKGKRTAWSEWNVFDDATAALCTLADTPTTDSVLHVLPTIERLEAIMYDRGSPESCINSEIQRLFTQKGR